MRKREGRITQQPKPDIELWVVWFGGCYWSLVCDEVASETSRALAHTKSPWKKESSSVWFLSSAALALEAKKTERKKDGYF